MSIFIKGSLFVFAILIAFPFTLFAGSMNLNVAVFNSGNVYSFVPIRSFQITGDIVNYTDIAGFKHQCLSNYFYFLYSKNSDQFLNFRSSSFVKGAFEYVPPVAFQNDDSKSYSVSLKGVSYNIDYFSNNVVKIHFKNNTSGTYTIKIYGYVNEGDFSAFVARIDGKSINNIFSNGLFFFLNKSLYQTSILGLSSCLSFKAYLNSGEHTITLLPQINLAYLHLTDIEIR